MDIWFTSDTHFSHKNILSFESRPFKNTEEMDEALITNWNSVVKPNDLIFHIGDVFFSNAKRSEWIASRLNGRKILVDGNHDRSFSKGKFAKMGFESHKYYFFNDYLLSHYPQNPIILAQASEYGLKGNIHGHVHSDIEGLDPNYHICVCTELTNYTPIHWDKIRAKETVF
ncbi:metallophosphoesterase [Priestia megaterium]